VRAGESRRLRLSRHSLFLVALVTLVLTPTFAAAKTAAVIGLLVTHLLVGMNLRRMSRIRLLRLLANDSVTLNAGSRCEIHGVTGQSHWVTNRLAIVSVRPLDRRRPLRLIVCRSLNRQSDYRRLAARLRLGSGRQAGSGILGGT
jgi:hypothetical protein